MVREGREKWGGKEASGQAKGFFLIGHRPLPTLLLADWMLPSSSRFCHCLVSEHHTQETYTANTDLQIGIWTFKIKAGRVTSLCPCRCRAEKGGQLFLGGPSPVMRDSASQLSTLRADSVSERNQLLKREGDFYLMVSEFSPMASCPVALCLWWHRTS